MYKGKTGSTSSKIVTNKRKSSTISKDVIVKSTLSFNSFNNVIKNNQSIDLNNSRKISNVSPGNSIILVTSNLPQGKMNRNKYTNSYSNIQLNKTRNSKDESVNLSKRLNTNNSVSDELIDHSKCLHTSTKATVNQQNCLHFNKSKNSSQIIFNIPKPPETNYNSNPNIIGKNSLNKNIIPTNKNQRASNLNLSNNLKSSLGEQQLKKELGDTSAAYNSINNNLNVTNSIKNTQVNNVTFNVNNTIQNHNNLLNTNPLSTSGIIHSSLDEENEIYVNSKNSKKKSDTKIPASIEEEIRQNSITGKNSLPSSGNIITKVGQNLKNFAKSIASNKNKNNIYDIIKGKKVDNINTNISTDKNNYNVRKNSTNYSSLNSKNNVNNQNNIATSIEYKRIGADINSNSLLISDNFERSKPKILENNINNSNQLNIRESPGNSPLKPVKKDQTNINLLGSIGFSSIELIQSPKADYKEEKENKDEMKMTGNFNIHRNEKKEKDKEIKLEIINEDESFKHKNTNPLRSSRGLSLDFQNGEKNQTAENISPTIFSPVSMNDLNQLDRNFNGIEPRDLEDDFNFNYNDEKIYSQNQQSSKKEIFEDDFIDDVKDNIDNQFPAKKEADKEKSQFSNITNNKYHMRAKSNFNFNNEPLTSIEEIDEKHLQQNTEENVRSTKEGLGNPILREDYQKQNDLIKAESDKFLKSKESSIRKNNSNNISPMRKSYKNEIDDGVNQLNFNNSNLNNISNNNPITAVNLNSNANSNINTVEKETKKTNSKAFDLKEDSKGIDSRQNYSNNININPIKNNVSENLKKNSIDNIDLTPINMPKDKNEVYQRARASRKSNEIDDLMTLKNLIDLKLNDNPQNVEIFDKEKEGNKKPITETKPKDSKTSIKNDSAKKIENLTSSPKKQLINREKDNSKEISKKPDMKSNLKKTENEKESIEKPANKKPTLNNSKSINTNLKSQKSSTAKLNTSNSNFKRSGTLNTSVNKSINKNKMNTTQNKDQPSFLEDDSKVLMTNQSKLHLKTGGNDLNGSRTFSKIFNEKEIAAAVLKAVKDPTKQRSSNLVNKNPLNTQSSRPSLRKSMTISDNKLKNFNRTNTNTTMNQSTLSDKKRSNFISKSKLQFNKPNVTDIKNTKMSRTSILGKIISTRSIKGDERTKNILTEIAYDTKTSADLSPTNKRSMNLGSLSRSQSSMRDSYDYELDRRFSGSLRVDDFMHFKRRNTKSFPDKFFKGSLFKKNSILLMHGEELNKSNNTTNGDDCHNLKIRINQDHILSRTRLNPKNKKIRLINKGKYEIIESYDASFNLKRVYSANELLVSPVAHISIGEKEIKEVLVLPVNLRKEQKDIINSKLSEKLKGNFIDESITKITKMNRLERMRNNRYSCTSISPTKIMNNYCFSPIATNRENTNVPDLMNLNQNNNFQNQSQIQNYNKRNNFNLKKNDNVNRLLSPDNLLSERTLKYSLNDDSNNRSNLINPVDQSMNSVVRAQRKIGNSKVVLMDNNFVICDDDKIFSPFDSILENNFINNPAAGQSQNFPEHLEITSNNNKRLEKLEKLERITNTVFNITKNISLKQHSRTGSISNINKNESIIVESSAFTIHQNENLFTLNADVNFNNSKERKKKQKLLEVQNVNNLFYEMHPEKNKFGFYSFNKEDAYTINAFSLIQNNTPSGNLLISNIVSETINPEIEKKKLEILSENNFILEKENNIEKTEFRKKISFNIPEDHEKEANNKEKEIVKPPSNLTQRNIKEKEGNSPIKAPGFLANENLKKISFAENIRNNINENDFFDKVKNILEAKRLYNQLSTEAILNKNNTEKSGENLLNKANVDINSQINKSNDPRRNQEMLQNPLNDTNITNSNNPNHLVQPMNNKSSTNIRLNTEMSQNNIISINNLELLSEKKKKEKQIELLNQRFHQKMNLLKNSKNVSINTEKDDEFENFKNEFRKNYGYLGTDVNSTSSPKMKNVHDLMISDEQFSEFKDKFLGKSEFIDKDQMSMFYKKYIKTTSNKEKFKNPFTKQEEKGKFISAIKEEKEVSLKLEKLKDILKLEDHKKIKELKYLNSQNFLYDGNKNDDKKENRNDVSSKYSNHLNASCLTNLANLNDSKMNLNDMSNNNINYQSLNTQNNKIMVNLSTLRFSNFGNSVNSNANKDNSVNKVLPVNNVNLIGNNSNKNAFSRELKYNF